MAFREPQLNKRDPHDPNRHKCAVDGCPLPGTLSPSTCGADKDFLCRHHFWNLKDGGKTRQRCDPQLAADYLQDMRDRLGVYRVDETERSDETA